MEVVAGIVLCLMIVVVVLGMMRALRRERRRTEHERSLCDEFAAYAALDVTLPPGACLHAEPARELARRTCAAIAQRSVLGAAALLLRDAELRLRVAGSAGFDDLTLLAVDAWGERFAREQRLSAQDTQRRSYSITVGPLEAFDVTRRSGVLGCRALVILPLWSSAGAMLGALACCSHPQAIKVQSALPPLEAVAANLARAIENAALSDRLLRAEKMAGLGQLAKGVAHELNNPLTSVLGYAELLAETGAEPATREYAGIIAAEALRMRQTVESLLQFWRPVTPADAAVNIEQLLRQAAERTSDLFAPANIQLLLQIEDDADTAKASAMVRGHQGRLLQVFEHLLRNAAHAVSASQAHQSALRFSARPRSAPGKADRAAERKTADEATRAVRVTLARERKTLQIVVSDTGPGFREPSRVFDPFYTTREPRNDDAKAGAGQGMGLAISYGIVREHGGEISAFNLTPHGAAVVVELPLARTVRESGDHAVAA